MTVGSDSHCQSTLDAVYVYVVGGAVMREAQGTPLLEVQLREPIFKLPVFLKLTDTDPFNAWFVVTGDVTPDGIRVVRSVLGAISSLLRGTGRCASRPRGAAPSKSRV